MDQCANCEKNVLPLSTDEQGLCKSCSQQLSLEIGYSIEGQGTEKKIRVLLKDAAQKRRSKNLDEAIALLRQAYEEIKKSNISFPFDTFLRLPLYLQQAAYIDESLSEFELLLNHGYPNQPEEESLILMDRSIIYDKMRLVLQREKRYIDAAKYCTMSRMSGIIALHKQDMLNDLPVDDRVDSINKDVAGLLNKGKRPELLAPFNTITKKHLLLLPNIDLNELKHGLDNIAKKK